MSLPTNFPSCVVGPQWGQWWRIHKHDHGPWWFANYDAAEGPADAFGRFDLPRPYGDCYMGWDIAASTSEALRERGVTLLESQEAASLRRLTAMPLNAYHGLRVADFTAAESHEHFGAPTDVGRVSHTEGQRWALAAHTAGFAGVLFRLNQDPERRIGLALFGDADEHAPHSAHAQWSAELPVGLLHELQWMFGGEWSGDPLAA